MDYPNLTEVLECFKRLESKMDLMLGLMKDKVNFLETEIADIKKIVSSDNFSSSGSNCKATSNPEIDECIDLLYKESIPSKDELLALKSSILSAQAKAKVSSNLSVPEVPASADMPTTSNVPSSSSDLGTEKKGNASAPSLSSGISNDTAEKTAEKLEWSSSVKLPLVSNREGKKPVLKGASKKANSKSKGATKDSSETAVASDCNGVAKGMSLRSGRVANQYSKKNASSSQHSQSEATSSTNTATSSSNRRGVMKKTNTKSDLKTESGQSVVTSTATEQLIAKEAVISSINRSSVGVTHKEKKEGERKEVFTGTSSSSNNSITAEVLAGTVASKRKLFESQSKKF